MLVRSKAEKTARLSTRLVPPASASAASARGGSARHRTRSRPRRAGVRAAPPGPRSRWRPARGRTRAASVPRRTPPARPGPSVPNRQAARATAAVPPRPPRTEVTGPARRDRPWAAGPAPPGRRRIRTTWVNGIRNSAKASTLTRKPENRKMTASELADLEELGEAEAQERVARRGHERPDRDEDRRRDPAVDLPGHQRPDGARERGRRS